MASFSWSAHGSVDGNISPQQSHLITVTSRGIANVVEPKWLASLLIRWVRQSEVVVAPTELLFLSNKGRARKDVPVARSTKAGWHTPRAAFGPSLQPQHF